MTAASDVQALPGRLLRAAQAAAAALVIAQIVVVAIWPGAHTLLIDLQVYRAGGEHVLDGRPLYDAGVLLDLPFVYPPFAALVFVPLAFLPLPVLKIVWTGVGLALLWFVVRRSATVLGARIPPSAVAVLVATALWLDPVRTTFYLGQINVVLLALVLADLTGRPGRSWRGVGVGVAAALKLTPLVFVVYLLLTGRITGRRRAAAVAVGTFVAATGLGFLVDPRDSADYWLHGIAVSADRISDVAATTNHSVNGLLARAAGEQTWPYLLVAAALAAAGLAVAVLAHRRGEELLALTLVGLLSAAVAPFAWSHHWVWFVPLVVILALRVRGSRAVAALAGLLAVTLAFVTRLPGPGVGPIPSTGLISLQPDVYLAAFVVIVLGARWWLGRMSPDLGGHRWVPGATTVGKGTGPVRRGAVR